MTAARALIAEDEPLLAAGLRAELATLWPELEVVASVGDGEAALAQALALRPDVVFLDIRMPGLSGLEVAQALVEDWPAGGRRFPLIVFVSAYDQYALAAFEHAAIDYVLKPIQPARLAATCERLRRALAPGDAPAGLDAVIEQIRALAANGPAAAAPAAAPLQVFQVGVGNAIHMVRVDDVLYLEAADKYVRVVTAEREHLIRVSLRELLPRLDANRFWQIHRGTVVRAEAIESAWRDENGRVSVAVIGRPERLAVSRLYSHLFKAM